MKKSRIQLINILLVVSFLLLIIVGLPFAIDLYQSGVKAEKMAEFSEQYDNNILAAGLSKDDEETKQKLLAALSYVGEMKVSKEVSEDEKDDIALWYRNGMTVLGYLIVYPEKKADVMKIFISDDGKVYVPCAQIWYKIEHAKNGDKTIRDLADEIVSDDDGVQGLYA